MPITTPPTAPSRTDPTTFPNRADAWVAWQETSLVPQINALEANVNAREASAVAASNSAAAASNAAAAVANATLWVSGTSYTLGQAVFDPVNFLTYRRAVAGAGTTRPGLDAVNWVQVAGMGNVSTTGDQTIGGVKTFTSSPQIGRTDLVNEGGQIDFQRASDGFGHYALDVVGAGTTPNFRLVNSPKGVAAWTVDDNHNFTAAGSITAGGQFIGNGSVPPGAVMHFAMNSPPTGWLRANGAAVSRATFAALFAAIGTTYGVGDGSTTFNLPDLRGEFLRGWDDGRGVDSGRVFGSAQAQSIQSHEHVILLAVTAGLNTETIATNRGDGNNNNGTTSTEFFWGTETRPRNVAMLACIKF